MKIEALTIDDLKNGLSGAQRALEKNCDVLDNLNVYPVPDGDTGVNMLFTLKPAVEQITNGKIKSVRKLFEELGLIMTNNSRGNSGFILSRFFYGFSEIIKEHNTIDNNIFREAFERGRYQVLASLMNPMPGTMVTIIEKFLESLEKNHKPDFTDLFDRALKEGKEALYETPKQLPVLARAGVIDSGALGFLCVMDGFIKGVRHEEPQHENEGDYRFPPDETVQDEINTAVPNRYCTEGMVENLVKQPDEELKNFIKEMGDSIALVCNDKLIKLHIHTNEPEQVFDKLREYGSLISQKVEDMKDQVSRILEKADETDQFAILSIIPGPGFEAIFRDLGAEDFVQYAETLPSAGEILEALMRIQTESVIVLPNDKNIIPAATMAAEEAEKKGKKIFILPTAGIIQGLTAMYGYMDRASIKDNISAMGENIETAEVLRLYKSGRDASFGSIKIEKGKWFTVKSQKVLTAGDNAVEILIDALRETDLSGKALISLYYNDSFDPEWTDELTERIEELGSSEFDTDLAVEVYYGGQKNETIILSAE